jgi:hypothetical protein
MEAEIVRITDYEDRAKDLVPEQLKKQYGGEMEPAGD